jgi:hypothetical protein
MLEKEPFIALFNHTKRLTQMPRPNDTNLNIFEVAAW